MSVNELQPELPYRVRQRIGPWIDRAVRALGQEGHLVRREEYVGTVELSMEELESRLKDAGFVWDPASLYHYTPARTESDGSMAYRSSYLADRQLHVLFFAQTPERIDVYAHDEYNWHRHPIKHFNQIDIRREQGAAEMRRGLDRLGVDYEHEPWPIRKLVHVAERLYQETLGSGVTTP
ncbi:MAG: hypothetical protein ABEJ28_03825 [Salinigranum sp.]